MADRPYNYRAHITADVMDYIRDHINIADFEDRDALQEHLYDECWIADSVTGNASGSYYCNAWKAEEAIAHNWDILAEAMCEFGCDIVNVIDKGAEWADVTIRCYLLGECIDEALDQLDEMGKLEFAEAEGQED